MEGVKKCIICGQDVPKDEKKSLNKKEIEILTVASIKKKDNKENEFKNLDSAIVHNNCNAVYLKETRVKSALRKLKTELVEKIDSTRRRSQRTKPNQTTSFNFTQLCLFCEEDASDDFISKQESLSLEKRAAVFNVSKPETKNKLLETIKTRSDKISQQLNSRIHNVPDLVKAGARYHSHCFTRFYNYQETLDSVDTDYPLTSENSSILTFVIDYILDHKEECQFSLTNIFKTYPLELNTFPTLEWLRDRLYEHFGNDILCHEHDKDIFVCYRDIRDKMIPKESDDKNLLATQSDEKRRRIVEAAADILFEDIRSTFYTPDKYKTSNYLLHDTRNDIPSNLQIFFDQLVKRNKKAEDYSKWDNRVTVLAHATLASVRPRSFLSSLQVRLSSTLYKKFSSKSIVNALSYLGLCASYDDTVKYESSISKDLRNNQLTDNFLNFWQGEEDNANDPIKAKKRKIQ